MRGGRIIGIDLGRTNIIGVITNLHAEIISEIRIPTFVDEGSTLVLSLDRKILANFGLLSLGGCALNTENDTSEMHIAESIAR